MSSIRIESAGQSWDFDQTRPIGIGREVDSDVELAEATISRRHAELRPVGDGWELVDLGSSHGTWSNGQRVTQVRINGRTEVRLGGDDAPTVVLTPGPAADAAPGAAGAAGAAAPATQFSPPSGGPAAPASPPPPAGAAAPPPYQPPAPAASGTPDPARPAAPAGGNLPPQGLDVTMVPQSGHPGVPGGGGPGLLVRSSVGDKRFPMGAPVRIGREPHLEVVTDDSAVSRQHSVIEPRPDGWWYVDRSRGGSFREDGERVTSVKISEPTTLMLGHPTAGFEVEIVPMVDAATAARSARTAAKAKKGGGKGGVLAVVVAVLALIIAVGGIGAFVFPGFLTDDDPEPAAGGGDGGLTTAELDRAKQASVQLTIVGPGDEVFGTGSGSIVSDDGMILTNAHVAMPSAPGQGGTEADDPEYLLVSLTSESDDTPVEPAYRAVPLVTDGYLDASIIQINATADGEPLDPADLAGELPEPMPIGDSDDLRTGDTITALGFPGIAQIDDASADNPALTVTRGVVSTFRADDVIGAVDEEAGTRAQIDSDIRIGSGNSGGASINDAGELVGINSAVFSYADMDSGAASGGTAIILPVNLTQDIRDIAADGGDPSYVSPYVESMPTPPSTAPGDVAVVSGGWTVDGQGNCTGSSTLDSPQTLSGVSVGDTITAEFSVTGLPDGTPIGANYITRDGEQIDSLTSTWSLGEEQVCAGITFTVPRGIDGINTQFTIDGQPVADNPVDFVG